MGESSQRSWWQRLGIAMAGVCAVLFVVTVGFWGHSHWYDDSLRCRRSEWPAGLQCRYSWFEIAVAYGDLEVEIGRSEVDGVTPSSRLSAKQIAEFIRNNQGIQWSASTLRLTGQASSDRVLGFSYDMQRFAGIGPWRGTGRSLSIPLALPAVLLAVWPVIVLMRWRKRQARIRVGLCRKCGYDLRASVERCPECGITISTEALAGKGGVARLAASPGWRLVMCSLLAAACLYWSWREARVAMDLYYRDVWWARRVSPASIQQWVCSGFLLCVGAVSLLLAVQAGAAICRRRAVAEARLT